MNLNRRLPDLKESGLPIVFVVYGVLIALNAATLIPGPVAVLLALDSNPLGPVLSIIVYDTPWSLAGIAGLVLLLGAVLFATPVSQRRGLSIFFVTSTILTGIVSGMIWDRYFDATPYIGAGVSAIAIAGQSVLFTLSIFGICRLFRQDTRRLGRMSSYWWYSFLLIYATIILTTIWFVVFLQSIFVPTEQYNWRVHEIAFFLAIAGTLAYEGLTWRSQGFRGRLAIDGMLANFHFDDLNDRFGGTLPKLRVAFGDLPPGTPGAYDPATSTVIVPAGYRDEDYRLVGIEFDRALLHGMVHAGLYLRGGPWQHGAQGVKEVFDPVAAEVGASPEP